MAKARIKKSAVTSEAADISGQAMLATLSIGFWDGRRKDAQTTSEVVEDAQASQDAGAWWTRIIPTNSLTNIRTAINLARGAHYKMTLPWGDDGSRALPSEMYFDYTAAMRKIREMFDEAVKGFVKRYPELLKEAPQRLGQLLHGEHPGDKKAKSMFPTPEEVGGKFWWQVSIKPLPMSGDFRVDLGKEDTDRIKEEIEAQGKAAMEAAMKDLWKRLHDPLRKMADALADEKGAIRDSMVKKVREVCELLPRLNVAGDPKLEEMRKEIVGKLKGTDTEALRKNPAARADAAKKTADILKKMDTFLGKK